MRDKGVSVAGLARSLGTSWGALNAAVLGKAGDMLAAVDPHRLEKVNAIGVEEHVWRHTPFGDRYVTVIVDITNHTRGRTARLLDVIPGRSARVVGTWLRKQGPVFKTGCGW